MISQPHTLKQFVNLCNFDRSNKQFRDIAVYRNKLVHIRRRQQQTFHSKVFAASASWKWSVGDILEEAGKNKRIKQLGRTLNAVGSLCFIVLYVWSTYSPPELWSWRQLLDIGLATFFMLDWIRYMQRSNLPLLTCLTKPGNLADVLAFLPTLIEALQGWLLGLEPGMRAFDLRWFRVFRAFRMLRISMVAADFDQLNRGSQSSVLRGALNATIASLLTQILVLLFTSASLVQLLERIQWHDALYFVTTTLTTVGYGDVVAASPLGRMVVLAMIAVGAVVIPVRTSQLYTQLSTMKAVLGPLPTSKSSRIAVYAGKISEIRSFSDFFFEFFHRMGKRPRVRMLGLSSQQPTPELRAFQELHDSQLTVVEGSALSERDLVRIRAHQADAIMLMADRFNSDTVKEDLSVLFQVWVVKSYVKWVPLCVQVIHKSSMQRIAPFLDPEKDVLVSLEQTRHQLLALACVCPGSSTLLGNLMRISYINKRKSSKDRLAGRRWLREYVNGCGEQLLMEPISEQFIGIEFYQVSEFVHRIRRVALIGIIDNSGKVWLNPAHRKMTKDDTAICVSFDASLVQGAFEQKFKPKKLLSQGKTQEHDEHQESQITCEPEALNGVPDSDSFDEDDLICQSLDKVYYKRVNTKRSKGQDKQEIVLQPIYPSDEEEFMSMQESNGSIEDDGISDEHESQYNGKINQAVSETLIQPRASGGSVRREIEASSWEKEHIGVSDLEGHIIVCGDSACYPRFAQTLRRCDPERRPIVLLHPSLPAEVWAELLKSGPVYHIKRSASEEVGLKAANYEKAKTLVYLMNSQRPAGSQNSQSELVGVKQAVLADADALLVSYGTGEENVVQKVHSVVELCFTSSVRFLQTGLLIRGTYAFDKFENLKGPRRSWIQRKQQERAAVEEGLAGWQSNPYYCAGRVTVPALLDTLVCDAFFNKGMLLDLLSELCGDDGRVGGSMLRLIPLPQQYIGKVYQELYQHLALSKKMIPLGLYRQKMENPAWRLPYVVTNPPRTCKLRSTDFVFVLRERGGPWQLE